VDALISLKANVNHPDNDKSTPLHKVKKLFLCAPFVTRVPQAAFAGFSRVMDKLLKAGADPSSVDVDGASSLHKAAFNNHTECVQRLLDKDPSQLNLADRFGSTPLHKAAYNNALESLKLLLSRGASVAVSDAHGLTPLHLAAYRGQLGAVIELLGSSRCPIDMQTESSQETALHCAARKGQTACAQRLVDAGANVALTNAAGLTGTVPLSVRGRPEVTFVSPQRCSWHSKRATRPLLRFWKSRRPQRLCLPQRLHRRRRAWRL
jgi:ankyrin repeat protein